MQSYLYAKPTSADFSYLTQDFDEEGRCPLTRTSSNQSAVDGSAHLSPVPTMADSRRESLATAQALFSPKTEDWQSVDMQSIPSNNPFMDQQDGNAFMRLDHDTGHTFGQSANVWGMNQSTSATPMPQFDANIASGFDASASLFQGSSHAQMPFANPGNMFASLGADAHNTVASPPDDWSATSTGMNKKPRPGSPHIRSHNEMRRGDGIRKRNARFDIPPDHNLSNIDQLIAQSTDEQEIKELKQQKRLLRNRQAALDSRQRKKLHTERLEDEKKQYTSVVNDLEMEVHALKAQIDQLRRDNQSYASYVDTLTAQKDEMIRTHTIDTRELRKKVSTLTEHIQHLESNGAPTPGANATAFGGAYGDGAMEGMCMPGGWDNANFLNSYGMEAEQAKPSMPMSSGKKADAMSTSENDKASAQGGLLFMLFLVGAFVMSSHSPPTLPRVSEDVRVASAALLNNVLKEAGVNSAPTQMQPLAPQPSSVHWQDMGSNAQMAGMGSDSVAPSMLGELGDFLQPTQQQNNEQLFSISAAQYNGVSDQSFMQNSASDRAASQSHGRKTLAAALSEIRASNKQTGTADVYTRSLLWDQIPRDVVRNFIKMVAENNNAAQHIDPQQCDEALS